MAFVEMMTQRRFHGQDIISWICLCILTDMVADLAMCLAGGLFLDWLMYIAHARILLWCVSLMILYLSQRLGVVVGYYSRALCERQKVSFCLRYEMLIGSGCMPNLLLRFITKPNCSSRPSELIQELATDSSPPTTLILFPSCGTTSRSSFSFHTSPQAFKPFSFPLSSTPVWYPPCRSSRKYFSSVCISH